MADAYWGAYWGAHNGAWMAANPEVGLFIWAVVIIGGILGILGIMLLELGRLLADWAEAYPKAAAAVVAAVVACCALFYLRAPAPAGPAGAP